MPGSFVDTNVFVYLTSGDQAKADRAEAVLRSEDSVISVQVLNEFTAVARRKMKLPWPELCDMLATIRGGIPVIPLTESIHETALFVAERYGFTIYDALIVADALHADCATLWSEDMQDGQLIEGRLRIRNPFLVSETDL